MRIAIAHASEEEPLRMIRLRWNAAWPLHKLPALDNADRRPGEGVQGGERCRLRATPIDADKEPLRDRSPWRRTPEPLLKSLYSSDNYVGECSVQVSPVMAIDNRHDPVGHEFGRLADGAQL